MGKSVNHTTPLRALLDTNVILDWLLDRKPWADDAQPLWDARDADQIAVYLSATTLTDIFYIARRQVGITGALGVVDQCLAAFEILAVDKALLLQARTLSGSDFEDNLQIACAQIASLDLIVTRNTPDFIGAGIPAIEPPQIGQYIAQP
ncbi:MAG TPA: PIN domain-containing protein [Ktedonobacterales bacterium]